MPDGVLQLELLEGRFAVARLGPADPVPDWASGEALTALTRTAHELSIVCSEDRIPEGVLHQGGFRALFVRGPLDFGAVGIVSSLAAPLARARVPIFVISTYDTDYLLVREGHLPNALSALSGAGHEVFTSRDADPM